MGLSFPERPQRIKAIKALLEKEGIWDVADKLLYRRLVTKEEACLAHTEKHWLDLEKLSTMSPDEREEWNKKNADFSLFCCADTWDAARLAAGGVLVAIDHIFVDGFRGVIFCWIRPPRSPCLPLPGRRLLLSELLRHRCQTRCKFKTLLET